MTTKHKHVWNATLYDGRWVEYCASLCGVPYRPARMRPSGAPVALARYDPAPSSKKVGKGDAA